MQNIAELLPNVDRKRGSLDMVNKVLKKDPYFLMAILHKAELLMDVSFLFKKQHCRSRLHGVDGKYLILLNN